MRKLSEHANLEKGILHDAHISYDILQAIRENCTVLNFHSENILMVVYTTMLH